MAATARMRRPGADPAPRTPVRLSGPVEPGRASHHACEPQTGHRPGASAAILAPPAGPPVPPRLPGVAGEADRARGRGVYEAEGCCVRGRLLLALLPQARQCFPLRTGATGRRSSRAMSRETAKWTTRSTLPAGRSYAFGSTPRRGRLRRRSARSSRVVLHERPPRQPGLYGGLPQATGQRPPLPGRS